MQFLKCNDPSHYMKKAKGFILPFGTQAKAESKSTHTLQPTTINSKHLKLATKLQSRQRD